MIEISKQSFPKQCQFINQILQQITKQKHSINKLVTYNNTVLTDCKDICNELNAFLGNTGHAMASKIPSNSDLFKINILNLISRNFFFFAHLAKDKK